mmetsp:Transcript_69633/g.220499  ORF Transcript_69633/g.220499 Transcript_69633/m.220499 type:complete len:212 (-) Transcript_69633:199-834(-)
MPPPPSRAASMPSTSRRWRTLSTWIPSSTRPRPSSMRAGPAASFSTTSQCSMDASSCSTRWKFREGPAPPARTTPPGAGPWTSGASGSKSARPQRPQPPHASPPDSTRCARCSASEPKAPSWTIPPLWPTPPAPQSRLPLLPLPAQPLAPTTTTTAAAATLAALTMTWATMGSTRRTISRVLRAGGCRMPPRAAAAAASAAPREARTSSSC